MSKIKKITMLVCVATLMTGCQSSNQQSSSSGSKLAAAIEVEPVVVRQGQDQKITVDLDQKANGLEIAGLAAPTNKLHTVSLVDIDNDVDISPKSVSIAAGAEATFSLTPTEDSSGDEKINILVDGAVVNSFDSTPDIL